MKNRDKNNKSKAVTIKEAADITGIPIHTIRFWEKEFEGFLIPERTEGGQRRFNEATIKDILDRKSVV